MQLRRNAVCFFLPLLLWIQKNNSSTFAAVIIKNNLIRNRKDETKRLQDADDEGRRVETNGNTDGERPGGRERIAQQLRHGERTDMGR